MAADGKVSCGDCVTDLNATKVHRLDDGSIVGCAGSAYSAVAFAKWLNDQTKERPHLADGFEALVLLPTGAVISYNDHFQSIQEPNITAIGSGMRFALAAMDAGATPAEAVRIASMRDTQSGGRITELAIGEGIEQ